MVFGLPRAAPHGGFAADDGRSADYDLALGRSRQGAWQTVPAYNHSHGEPMTGSDRKREFIDALRGVVEEKGAQEEPLSVDEVIASVSDRMGTTIRRSTFEPAQVAAPFPAPDGFHYPIVPPRPPTARQRAALIAKLAAPRPETRRMAVELLGRTMDDPLVRDAIRTASTEDPDPVVRGSSLLCLGLAGFDPEGLIAGARRLIREAPEEKRGTRASDMAWDGAGEGVLGALLAAVGSRRRDLAEPIRGLAELLDPRQAADFSNAPLRRRNSLLKVITEFERAPDLRGDPS